MYNRGMSSIFSKIIRGEVPSYKIYEDEKTFAFLDIHPETEGHVLVVPKIEVDKVYDLPPDDYRALWETVRRVARQMDEVLGKRVLMKVIGTDVAHAHVHLVPLDEGWYQGRVVEAAPERMEEIAETIRLR